MNTPHAHHHALLAAVAPMALSEPLQWSHTQQPEAFWRELAAMLLNGNAGEFFEAEEFHGQWFVVPVR